MRAKQAGDTIIEVLIATVIIGSMLLTAYTLSSRAITLGQSSSERTDGVQLAETQAEAIRALRDSAGSWEEFKQLINSNAISVAQYESCRDSDFNLPQDPLIQEADGIFHLSNVNSGWAPGAGTDCATPFEGTEYETGIAGTFTSEEIAGTGSNAGTVSSIEKFTGVINIGWERFGGGTAEDSTSLIIELTSNDTSIEPYFPEDATEFDPCNCTPPPC